MQRRRAYLGGLACAFCAILALAACPKKRVEASIEPSVSESPVSDPRILLKTFGSEGSFTEPSELSRFSLALEGGLTCPPVMVRDSLACAFGDRIVLLERDGANRSISLPGLSREILCSYEAAGAASLVVLLSDGGLICLDYDKLTVSSQAKGSGSTTLCAVSGFATGSANGPAILRVSGKKIERLSLPRLDPMENAESLSDIHRIASNGDQCLLFCGGEKLADASIVDANAFTAELEAISTASGAAPADPSGDADRKSVVWAAGLGSGFIALQADGKAAFLAKGAEPEYLSGSFDPNLDGCGSSNRIALVRSDGKLCAISEDPTGEIRAEDIDMKVELTMPLDEGWLWYAGGRLGYARSSGTPLWTIPTTIAPRFPPIVWDGRIVLCARDGLHLFPGNPDQGLERSIGDALVSSQAATAIRETLATMRAEPAAAEAGIDGAGLDIAPYRPLAIRNFSKGWRVSVFEPAKSLSYRIGVKGRGAYLIAVFDSDGAKTLSNLGYGIEDSLELTLMQGKKYSIAFAPSDPARDAEAAELSIQTK